MKPNDRLLSNEEAAHMLGIKPETLKNWRSSRPQFGTEAV